MNVPSPEQPSGLDGHAATYGTPAELALYIADMAEGLGILARSADLCMLAHLLDMVRLEALSHDKADCRPPHAP